MSETIPSPRVALPRVLIVDDDPQVLASIRRTLRPLGLSLELAECPERALELLLNEPFAAVIADQFMPKMLGTALLARARREAPFVERLLLSGGLDQETALAAVNEAGVGQLLAKPWSPLELRSAVGAAVNRHAIRIALREVPAMMSQLLAAESEEELVRLAVVHFGSRLSRPSDSAGLERASSRFLVDGSLSLPELEDQPPELRATLEGLLQTALGSYREARELRSRARNDGLTGLYNRDYLDRVLECVGSEPGPLSLVMVDVDHFKQVNDTYGHPAGDQVLCRVAATLRDQSRSSDAAFRYGGDEFVVLLRGTGLAGARIYVERVQQAFREADPAIAVTLSIGVAEHVAGGRQEDLLRRADEALYEAKRSGRNRVSVAHSGEWS